MTYTGQVAAPVENDDVPKHNSHRLHLRTHRRGMGFSAPVAHSCWTQAQTLVALSLWRTGSPACVGPVLDNDLARLETKQLTSSLL
ncbi:MAG: hypothetical protein R2838_03300 [Caldilineaceae bacterium]